MLFSGSACLSVEILCLSAWQYVCQTGKQQHSADGDQGKCKNFFPRPQEMIMAEVVTELLLCYSLLHHSLMLISISSLNVLFPFSSDVFSHSLHACPSSWLCYARPQFTQTVTGHEGVFCCVLSLGRKADFQEPCISCFIEFE